MSRSTLLGLRQCALRWCKRFLTPVLRRPSFSEWLDSTSFNEKRKEELRTAEAANRGSMPPLSVCRKVKNFIKHECYPEYKHARLINSRCDRFKVWCGPLFKAIEERVYDTAGPIRFIKHVPVVDRPALISALPKGMRCYSTDFTSFEKHFTADVMENIEMVLYDYMLPFLSKAERGQLHAVLTGVNEVRCRSGFRAKVKARRMSGEMCTSLGNGFTNLIIATYLAEQKGGYICGFVEGDDGLFCSTVDLSSSDYAACGFDAKVKVEADPCSASFCGMIFSDSGEIIRDPRQFFCKFSWTANYITAGLAVKKQLLRAKALSTVYETPQCPIVGALARRALQLTSGCNARFEEDGYHDTRLIPRDVIGLAKFHPSDDTRMLFAHKFGIGVSAQLYIEDLIMRGDMEGVVALMPPPAVILHYFTRYVG